MTEIIITDIKWENRGRKDYGDIAVLAESLRTHGLIQPIVIDDNKRLIAGGRRLSAAISLGWTSIPCHTLSDLSDLQRLELELEENLRRKNLTWQEEARMTEQIHRLKSETEDDWSVEDTGKTIDKATRTVYKRLELAKGLKEFPELASVPDVKVARTQLRRKLEARRREAVKPVLTKALLFQKDAVEGLRQLKDAIVDLVLLDPPYGLNLQTKSGREWTWEGMTFNDERAYALALLDGILAEVKRILKPGGHCYVFFNLGDELGTSTIQAIIKKHLAMQSTPLFWIKTTISNYRPFNTYGINYEPLYFCWKEKQKEMNTAHFATFTHSVNVQAKKHPNQKPRELYEDLIRISSNPGDLVLDPTAGSGMSLVAAKGLGRRIIGIEKDPIWYALMQNNLQKEEEDDKDKE